MAHYGRTSPAHQRREIDDIPVDCMSRSDLLKHCLSDIYDGNKKIVFDINGHGVSLAATSSEYRNDLKSADIIHADGGYIVSLSRIKPGPSIPERSSTTDMIHDFASEFAQLGHSFYLLGGTEQVNKNCARILSSKYPGLNIVGRRNGFFEDKDESEIIAEINRLKPDVLWVGLGKPKEQAFCRRWKGSIDAAWTITCGGCYNYITGDYSRAPMIMQKLNLEWLHRMFTNPRKLFLRYLITTPHALALTVLKMK